MKRLAYGILLLAFLAASACMIYYGKLTFHMKKAEAEQDKSVYHFVLIPEEMDNEYWRLVEKGARDAAGLYGVYLEYAGPRQADYSEHLKTLDTAIAGKVDGILMQGGKSEMLTTLISKAHDKGIPVITVDTDAPETERAAYVGTNNYYSGFLAGQALLADTNGSQRVGIVTGRFQSENQKQRVEGFKEAIKKDERIQIVGIEESSITKIGAIEATYRLFHSRPDITAIYGTSALDGIGIAGVTRYFNKKNIYVIAFDTLPETLFLLNEQAIQATVAQDPYEMGYNAVASLIKLKAGENIHPLQYTDTSIIRREDLPIVEGESGS
ncbi:sugar-binding protein [Domibacillus sp. PGB-M46]|uniref:sugar-binding protein n=1 Tax=Domibacillus sp. PGB-M46 TaxID=2910255 RepID=UPI001F59E25B|nr:sugar-binding protein [Domibacillus sp. PGB-M46]MCI2255355.1 sugar-binding protein [Domibacillus sp. PGB-M46]